MSYFDVELNLLDGLSVDSGGVGSVNQLRLDSLYINGETTDMITAISIRFDGAISYHVGQFHPTLNRTVYPIKYTNPHSTSDIEHLWLTVQSVPEITSQGIDQKLIFRTFKFPDDLPINYQPQIDLLSGGVSELTKNYNSLNLWKVGADERLELLKQRQDNFAEWLNTHDTKINDALVLHEIQELWSQAFTDELIRLDEEIRRVRDEVPLITHRRFTLVSDKWNPNDEIPNYPFAADIIFPLDGNNFPYSQFSTDVKFDADVFVFADEAIIATVSREIDNMGIRIYAKAIPRGTLTGEVEFILRK